MNAPAASLRIDKLLWFLRFSGSRNHAQDWVCEGHIRLNGRRIERPSAAVRCGDVLVLPIRGAVRVIEIVSLPARRGPAVEAQGCYRMMDAGAHSPGLDGQAQTPLAPAQTSPEGQSLP